MIICQQLATKSPAEAIERVEEPMTTLVGEQLLGHYLVIDLPDDGSTAQACSADQPLVTTALLAHIEFLESECSRLQNSERNIQHFGIDQIKHAPSGVLYTGFPSFATFLAFFSSLGQFWISYNTEVANKMLRKDNVQRNLLLWTNCS